MNRMTHQPKTIGTSFTLVLQALPSDVPVMIRLRRVLKGLLRTYDFRAVSVLPAASLPPKRTSDECNL